MKLSKKATELLTKKVVPILSEQLGVANEEVTPHASLTDDLGADSLDVVELVMALEEEFGMEIPDEDAERISKVSDIVVYLGNHIVNNDYFEAS